jgi:hypothetical protein
VKVGLFLAPKESGLISLISGSTVVADGYYLIGFVD